MLIRPAGEDELAAVGELTVAGYAAEGFLLRTDGSYDQDYADWLGDAVSRARDAVLLVAIEDDEVLGTVTWCPYGSRFSELATRPHQGEFRALSVAPAGRRRGVGRALVAACLDLARAAGHTEVVLCSMSAMAPAHRLYESVGFRRRPELDWSPVPGIDLWAFWLDL